MTTLEEALTLGRGVERPFRCFKHDDTTASASVNVLRNVWYCYVCRVGGVVDSSRVPTTDELYAMLEPEKATRTYPTSWLATYAWGGYWLDRFPDWLCWWHGLGEDPWTGEATFPVHTPGGRLAGVGRRAVVSGPGPRYRYPSTWSASRTLYGSFGRWPHQELVVLNEGAADAASVQEVGVFALGTYGAGLHRPQVELLAQITPKLVLFGFDMDEAGDRATQMSEEMLDGLTETAQVHWPRKDPAECTPEERMDAILRTVRGTSYGSQGVEDNARANVIARKNAFVEEARSG